MRVRPSNRSLAEGLINLPRVGFKGSYIWGLPQLIGSRLILGPGAVVVPVMADGRVLLLRRPDFEASGSPP